MSEKANRSGAAVASNPFVKLAIEIGPLVAFFAAWLLGGAFWATGVLMVASVTSVIASRIVLGHVSPAVMTTAALVLVFGGLTLWFRDTDFLKLKVTILNLLFAGVLLGGLVTGRPLLRLLFGEAFKLTEEGWRKLTVRWIVFFVALAGLNEVVRGNFSEAVWFNFKAYGILLLTLAFAMAQVGLIKRHEAEPRS
jgi:intracellular septation protein